MQKGYILVFSSADAFYGEEILKEIPHTLIKLMPTPRELSSDCGICIYFECQNQDILTQKLDEKNLEYEIKLQSF
ncbi:hypothetical protein B6S12_08200 [Helicobacter valdiviensis]|uniref:Putative Se/S carrier protein-like domain-containing protein n=1 Tax=Helicobacter valdiviensis TaxID=1458358 RepID=A0A2W6NF33_9HELI|nr:DUF3343 domain-containing protein [Helicobacter valdiviensis]PZT47600.1 hypothetical protein B6S12_08200 [Helicobacter valdiviensis]